jgi:hypothetical protein
VKQLNGFWLNVIFYGFHYKLTGEFNSDWYRRDVTLFNMKLFCKFEVYGLRYMRVYPKVSGLAALSENCKWHSSLPLGAVVSLFCESVYEFCHHDPFCCFSTSNTKSKRIFRCGISPETFGYTLIASLSNMWSSQMLENSALLCL